jgi:hypothetical protein
MHKALSLITSTVKKKKKKKAFKAFRPWLHIAWSQLEKPLGMTMVPPTWGNNSFEALIPQTSDAVGLVWDKESLIVKRIPR